MITVTRHDIRNWLSMIYENTLVNMPDEELNEECIKMLGDGFIVKDSEYIDTEYNPYEILIK